jgi:hypothetical protein
VGASSSYRNILNQQNALTGARLEVPNVCFVQDNRSNVGKLNPRVIKCIFVGYSDLEGICMLESCREEIICEYG